MGVNVRPIHNIRDTAGAWKSDNGDWLFLKEGLIWLAFYKDDEEYSHLGETLKSVVERAEIAETLLAMAD